MSRLCIAFGVCAASNAFAQDTAAKVSGWVRAVVVTDGAAVYEKADFDSPVQTYLGYQTPVLVSKKVFQGRGGLGLFHRIRYGEQYGFVADTDINAAKGAKVEAEKSAREGGKPPSKAWEPEEERELGKAPLYLTRYLGGALAMVNFTERFTSRKLSDQVMMYGLRMLGPGTLFDGPPLDFNFWFSFDKPSYYGQFASGSPSGFLMFGDVAVQLPLVDTKNWLVTYGFGLMWVYTRYSVPVRLNSGSEVTFDSQELRWGVDVGVGGGRRFGRYMVRGDVKYYYERLAYLGYVLSVQTEY